MARERSSEMPLPIIVNQETLHNPPAATSLKKIPAVNHVRGDPLRNQGRILTGNEYLTVFNGLTGAAMKTIDYIPERGQLEDWEITVPIVATVSWQPWLIWMAFIPVQSCAADIIHVQYLPLSIGTEKN